MTMLFKRSEYADIKPPNYTRQIPKCGACQLHTKCKSPKMPIGGQGKKDILLITDTPTTTEDKHTKHFIGKSNQFLHRHLKQVGIEMSQDCWKTSALICKPPNNRKPTHSEINYCNPNLERVLRKLKPRVIIPMGEAAVSSLFTNLWKEDSIDSIARWTGWSIPNQQLNAWIFPTYHPLYVIYRSNNRDKTTEMYFHHHLKTAANAPPWRPWKKQPNWKNEIIIDYSIDEVCKWLNSIQDGIISFDYETDRLKPNHAQATIVCCAVSHGQKQIPKKTVAFPWCRQIEPAMSRLLKSNIPKIGANLQFEDRWTRKILGHRVKNWLFDCVQGAHVCDNRQRITSVKFQSFVRLGLAPYDEHIEEFLKAPTSNSRNRIHEIKIEHLLEYCGFDALLEYRLAFHQMNELNYPMP